VEQGQIVVSVERLLGEIQKSLHDRALAFRKANTREPRNYEEFKQAVEAGFAYSFWCGSSECEAKIKEETKATMRCIPLGQPGDAGVCIYCGKPATERGIFGRAY
jgi:prolyl-tRNA synthetase